MKTSKYLLLNPYVLMEYVYTDPASPEYLTNQFYRVSNAHTGFGPIPSVAILNLDNQVDITGNVQERSALRTGAAVWNYLDKDQTPTWLTQDPLVTVTTVTATSQPFDEIRFHLMAGYNFEDLDGLIFTVQATERSTKKITLADIAYQKSALWATFAPRPLLINDRLYDRYVSVKIPSVYLVQQAFDALEGSPSQASSFAALITSDGKGFMRNIPLTVTVTEIASTTSTTSGSATYLRFQGAQQYQASVNQFDENAPFAAVIQPSASGDFFEYYGTWNGQFMENYIYQQNSLGNLYVLVHHVKVVEQVGGSFFTTADFQFVQTDGFDAPNYFRPIVRNADTAISYSIDYTVRLYNKKDSSQVIRTGSYTGFDPKSWGPSLSRIKLAYEPMPYKVYNKVVSGPSMSPSVMFPKENIVSPPNAKVVVPVFFEKNSIVISNNTLYVGKDGTLQQGNTSGSVALKGVGECNVNIDPFDNWFKFQIFQEAKDGSAPTPVDLGTNVKYSMVFVADDSTKISYPAQDQTSAGSLTQGVAVFKIPAEDTPKVLAIKDKKFYLSITSPETGTSSFYWGWFNSPDKVAVQVAVAPAEPAAAPGTNITADITDQLDSSKPALPSGTKIPTGVKPSTLQQLKPSSPGATSSIATDKSSILSKMKPKSPNKKIKQAPDPQEPTLEKKLSKK